MTTIEDMLAEIDTQAKIEATIVTLSTEIAARITEIGAIYTFELGEAALDGTRAEEFCKELSNRIKRGCNDLFDKLCEITGASKSLLLEGMDADIPNITEVWRNVVAA